MHFSIMGHDEDAECYYCHGVLAVRGNDGSDQVCLVPVSDAL
jgi:hypothetical protein